MKLIEALEITNARRDQQAPPRRYSLVCGFTPLHLLTFLRAHLQLRPPSEPVEIATGLYGDLYGNIERLQMLGTEAAAIVVEWPDLDPRLSMRQIGGWGVATIPDLVSTVNSSLRRLECAIHHMAEFCIVALSVPTLPVPPCFLGPGWLESSHEAELNEAIAAFVRRLTEIPSVRPLNQQRLQQLSPGRDRHDLSAELQTGFPYRLPHTDILAGMLAASMEGCPPLKGIITDLDDTMWRGILGDIGPQCVAWDLAGHAQIHGVYQQMLDALAERGVLIGIATKNDRALVDEALGRADFRIGRERVFPVEAGWGPKSESVHRILRAWNIAADAVLFVDDSAMEIAEVKFAHPEIECRQFPAAAPEAFVSLLEDLRDRFSKPAISLEDRIRSTSIRSSQAVRDATMESGSPDTFLQTIEARCQISFRNDATDVRAFELVNKTNQFNLNGKRFTAAEWHARLATPNTFMVTVSYRDKFGPLGKVAVLVGSADLAHEVVRIATWVISCRAFSRRIEYQCLRQLFQRFQVQEIIVDFVQTPRNEPIRECLAKFGEPGAEFRFTQEQFEINCPPLYHCCEEVTSD